MTRRQWAAGKNGRGITGIAAITGAAMMLAGAAALVTTPPAAASHGPGLREPAAVARPGRSAGNSPGPGFWSATDSATMNVPGPAPYREPVIGGSYGGYIGMTGNWANLTGCHKIVVWSDINSSQANNNYTWHHIGIGTGVYYFMGGPGVDPHYTGTTGEAYAWGEQQAARTIMDISHVHVKYPVAFADIEIPGTHPATPRPPTTAGTPCTPRRAAASPRRTASPPRWTALFSTGSPPT
jgi:hypothetical protein